MNRKVKNQINVILVTIALAMGVAVIVLSMLDENITTNDLIKMLGVAVVSLGIYCLNKEEKGKTTE
jgi:protein-S-isoprenylcysteine O-methyltransferase Ste14